MARRRSWMAVALVVACALPCVVSAQTRLSLGVGGGIAGSTDASLSEGRSGIVLMGQLVHGVLPFAGLGMGDPDGAGTMSGAAAQIGLSYDLTIPAAPIAVTLFGNGSVAYSSSRSMQLVDAGIAITLR